MLRQFSERFDRIVRLVVKKSKKMKWNCRREKRLEISFHRREKNFNFVVLRSKTCSSRSIEWNSFENWGPMFCRADSTQNERETKKTLSEIISFLFSKLNNSVLDESDDREEKQSRLEKGSKKIRREKQRNFSFLSWRFGSKCLRAFKWLGRGEQSVEVNRSARVN